MTPTEGVVAQPMMGSGAMKMFKQDLYEESSTQKHPLGTVRDYGDRVFVYSKASEALTLGNLLESTATVVAVAATKFDVVAAGATELLLDITITKDAAKEGFLCLITGTSIGATRKIRNHSAGTAGSADATFYFYEPCPAVDATTVGSVILNQWVLSQHNFANPMATPVRASAPMSVTSGYYFWAQKEGIGTVIAGATTIDIGCMVQGDEAVAGSGQISVAGEKLTSFVGVALADAADTVGAPVDFRM